MARIRVRVLCHAVELDSNYSSQVLGNRSTLSYAIFRVNVLTSELYHVRTT